MAQQEQQNKLASLRDSYRDEQARLQREINENETLVRQSTQEVERLVQREMTVSNRIRDLEVNLERYSKAEIKNFFAAAQEVQMRLHLMKAQLEQLQLRQTMMKAQQKKMAEVVDLLDDLLNQGAGTNGSGGPTTNAQSDELAEIIATHEADLHRISIRLHDGPVQTLANLVLRAEIGQKMLERDPEQARTELASLRTSINAALQEGRRLIFDLRPMTIDDLGLVATLRRFGQEFGKETNLEVSVIIQGLEQNNRLPRHYELALFRFVQEALNNVAKHAQATQARVVVSSFENMLQVVIEDNGVGFPVSQVMENPQGGRRGTGLINMKKRIEVMLHGEFGIESSIGQGTRIAASVPIP